MRPTLITLLLLHLQSFLVLSLQPSSFLPRFVKDISSGLFGHSAYVDHRVYQTPRSFLNHEQWHQRHMVAFMNASSVTYITMSSPTGNSSMKSLGSSLSLTSASGSSYHTASVVSAPWSATVSTNISSASSLTVSSSSASNTALQAASLASLLGYTENLEADTSANWDDRTESACSTALIALHGVATNPSGIAACYNIRSLDNSTGIFDVDLRLYRISAPREAWVQLDASSVGVGLSYVNATVSATQAKKAKRDDRTLPWFPAQKDEAADIYIRRSTGVPPRRLESMSFVGTVDEGHLAKLKDSITAQSLLTPVITLSGSGQDGSRFDARLSTDDASFVSGVFAPAGIAAMDGNVFVLPGTTFVGFPVGLIITSVWAVLYMTTMGYGTMDRYQARESYRRRVKKRFSGDAITKRTMRWA